MKITLAILSIITTLITIFKFIKEINNVENYKNNLKYFIGAILYFIGLQVIYLLLMLMIVLIVSTFSSIKLNENNYLQLFLIGLIFLGLVLMIIKLNIESKFLINISEDNRYVWLNNKKIDSEIITVLKSIEISKRHGSKRDLYFYHKEIKKLNKSKLKLSNLSIWYARLNETIYLLFYVPSIFIVFEIAKSNIHTNLWLVILIMGWVELMFSYLIYQDFCTYRGKIKVTKDVLQKHLKVYEKEVKK